MRQVPKKIPAVCGGRGKELTQNHLVLIAHNDKPRQPWRARPPYRPVEISDELRAYFDAMGATHGER